MTDIDNPSLRIEQQIWEKHTREWQTRLNALTAASDHFTKQGFRQLKTEFDLRTIVFRNGDVHPLVHGLLALFSAEMLRLPVGDAKWKALETDFFRLCEPRIQARQLIGMSNPVSLDDWRTELLGQSAETPTKP